MPSAITSPGGGGTTLTDSASLRTALSDENGTGVALFDSNTNATFITPALGVPSALTLTNATGLPPAGVTGTAAILGANTFTARQANSANGATSASAVAVTGVPFAGTGTTSFPLVYVNDANATPSSTMSTAGTYFGINGDGTQDLINVMKDGVTVFKITSTGLIQGAGGSAAIGFADSATSIGRDITLGNGRQFYLNSALTAVMSAEAAGIVQFGADAAGVTNYTLKASDRITSDGVGANLTIAGGRNRGADVGGSIIFQTSPAAAATVTGTLATALTIDSTKLATFAGGLVTTPQTLSGAGAVNVTTGATAYTSTGAAEALTLADGTAGQIKTIAHVSDGGSGVLTPTTKSGYSTITFTNAGDAVTLQYFTTAGWIIVGQNGVVVTP